MWAHRPYSFIFSHPIAAAERTRLSLLSDTAARRKGRVSTYRFSVLTSEAGWGDPGGLKL